MATELDPEHGSIQVPCDSAFLSFPSEAEDVRNWFPGYEYESPSLDTCCGSDFPSLLIGLDNSLEASQGGNNKRKYEQDEIYMGSETSAEDIKPTTSGRSPKKSSKIGNPTHNGFEVFDFLSSIPSEPPDIRTWYPGYVYESPELGTNECFGSAMEDDIENPNTAKKCTEMENFNGSTVLKIKREELPFPIKISPRSENEYQNNHFQRADGSLLVKATSSNNECTQWTPANLVKEIKKENEGINSSENGFISTKNNGSAVKGVHCMGKHKEVKFGSPLIPLGLYSFEKRKVLLDVTNSGYSSGPGISGKWQCTKNRKLKHGPPMKQVGLDRWVQRL